MPAPRWMWTTGLALTGALALGAIVQAQQPQAPVRSESGLAPTVTPETPLPPAPPDETTAAPPDETAAAPASSADDQDSSDQAEQSAAPAKPAAPMTRPKYGVAVLQALDKVTAQTIRFEAPIGKPIRYKTLVFIVHACETTAADEAAPDAAAHIEIDSQPLPVDGKVPPARRVFQGWMFANAPGANLFQHPVYDAWLIACKTDAPSA